MSHTYFVTGALGCIGAWVVKHLVERGDTPVVYDLGSDPYRIKDLLDDDAFARVRFVTGDITDLDATRRAVQDCAPRAIIHLAGLQVPFCKQDPALGAKVNVLGTIHLFEAARAAGVPRLAYASSAAVYGPQDDDTPPDEAAAAEPTTHYGVYKRANEGTARVYAQDNGLSSVGLRPLTIYGVGRDRGMTSGPTKAMKAAIAGRPYEIAFTGATDFHFVGDTAATFVRCADGGPDGARVYNVHGDTETVADVIATIEELHPAARGTLTATGAPLPIPPHLDGAALHRDYPGLPRTGLRDGIAQTLQGFAALRAAGRLSLADLDA